MHDLEKEKKQKCTGCSGSKKPTIKVANLSQMNFTINFYSRVITINCVYEPNEDPRWAVSYSDDDCETWQDVFVSAKYLKNLRVEDGVLLIDGDSGELVSKDHGATWE